MNFFKIVGNIFISKFYLFIVFACVAVSFSIYLSVKSLMYSLESQIVEHSIAECNRIAMSLKNKYLNNNTNNKKISDSIYDYIGNKTIIEIKFIYKEDEENSYKFLEDYYDEKINSFFKNIMKISIPLYDNNSYIGTYEFYYDITKKKQSFIQKTSDIKNIYYFVGIFLMTFGLIMLYIASRNDLINKYTKLQLKKLNDNLKDNISDKVEKLRKQERILSHQSKQAALGEMIGVIAHQWRQPLHELNLNNAYLKEIVKDDNLSDVVINNEEIVNFMSNTITNFENFYKDTKDESFNLSQSIEEVLILLETLIKKEQINFIKEIDVDIEIFGKRNNLAQVVLTIIQNAIEIFKERQRENPTIKIVAKKEKEKIIITIEDNAGGTGLDDLSDMFKMFKSFKKNQSSGIGLYMAKIIIEDKFHGTLGAKNINNGIVFEIKI